MAPQKPSIPKGTRDFSPAEMARRNYLFDTIRSIFGKYGFAPIETPAMENLSTLMGKYGEEGDKLLFKVLNSGNFLKGIGMEEMTAALESDNPAPIAPQLCEKGLRYDLTVPFARYVVQHQNEITFPFKRYQIQPVWRADRPQKGRYREFYQCDVDVVGSRSLINELELIQIVQEVFTALHIRVGMKLNNRKILAGIAQVVGQEDKIVDITVAIDKLDKIGIEAVNQELLERGIPAAAAQKLQPVLLLQGSNAERLEAITAFIGTDSEIGLRGIAEVRTILDYAAELEVSLPLELDLSLARGLNYYTGAIFEVKALDFEMGSICGGGRYDDLTGIFGLPDTSGVGISFGADRIYDVMLGLDLFPPSTTEGVHALFANFGPADELEALKLLKSLRQSGIAAEIYPEATKIKRQFDYAERKGIPYLIFVGEAERTARKATVKNIISGLQQEVSFEQLASYFQTETCVGNEV